MTGFPRAKQEILCTYLQVYGNTGVLSCRLCTGSIKKFCHLMRLGGEERRTLPIWISWFWMGFFSIHGFCLRIPGGLFSLPVQEIFCLVFLFFPFFSWKIPISERCFHSLPSTTHLFWTFLLIPNPQQGSKGKIGTLPGLSEQVSELKDNKKAICFHPDL